jgi:Holliday junction resolvase
MKKRKQTKLYASKKQILDIYEFMEIYVGKKYTWNEQLTHKK